jgi:acylphosphatase
MEKALEIIAKGRVQRVGYRRFVLDVAQDLALAGDIRNMSDGSASIFVQGEEDKLKTFLELINKPPEPARISYLEVSEAAIKPKVKGFSIIYGRLADELQEGFGAMQAEFRDYRNEFRDYRSEFSSFAQRTDNNLKSLNDKIDVFSNTTDANFKELDKKHGEISAKLSDILNSLTEQSKRSQEMLEEMRSESRKTAESLDESLRLLREAVERLPKASG